jgi:hypothetical protein
MAIDSYGSDVGWVVNNIGAHLWADDFGSMVSSFCFSELTVIKLRQFDTCKH